MNPEVIVAVLGAGGLGAIFAAIVTGLFSKRKLGAEATEIITKAAAGVVTNLQAEIDRQVLLRTTQATEAKAALDLLVKSHAEEMDEVRRVLQLHVAWDAIAIAKMAEMGVDLPPAPPLLPARRFDHPDSHEDLPGV
jgi:hypothetical protein